MAWVPPPAAPPLECEMSEPRYAPRTKDEYLAFITDAILDAAKASPPPNRATPPTSTSGPGQATNLASHVPSTQTHSWRVYAISDLHADMKANLTWVNQLPKYPPNSALIVAGDVATSVDVCRTVFTSLKQKFEEVFWVFGNHELWLPAATPTRANDVTRLGYPDDSLGKLKALIDVCVECGVRISPTVLPGTTGINVDREGKINSNDEKKNRTSADVLVVPIIGWYDDAFGGHSNRAYTQVERDFDAGCKWPSCVGTQNEPRNSHSPGIGLFFQSVNNFLFSHKLFESCFQSIDKKNVVTFSHFVPLSQVYRGTSSLVRVMGNETIGETAFSLNSKAHVFGHSHVNADDSVCGGDEEKKTVYTRFVQNALGYPNERWLGNGSPKLVWPRNGGDDGMATCATS